VTEKFDLPAKSFGLALDAVLFHNFIP